MRPEIDSRIFVVGCARSGTTLVQAMLASHSKIYGFPETFFFVNYPDLQSWLSPTKIWRQFRSSHWAYQEAMERLDISQSTIAKVTPASGLPRKFIHQLDQIALLNHKSIWTEKTPGHINHLEQIRSAVPKARFVHVLRDGRDVIASLEALYQQRKTENEHASVWDLENSITQWNNAISISRSYQNSEKHHLLCYEDLVENSEATLVDLCSFIGVEYQREMIDYHKQSSSVLGNDIKNSWRRDVLKPIRSTHLVKYDQLFNESQKEEIEARLYRGGTVSTNTHTTMKLTH